jgi:peptidoglycan/LPS O-acetylase OafA/YrhL
MAAPSRAGARPLHEHQARTWGAETVGLSRSRSFIPELESLRGIAVLLVVAFHVDGFVHFPFPWSSNDVSLPVAFVRAGHTGVDLFFVLSAFLLARPFLDDGLGGRPVRRRDFFARRALRIFPLYWVAVLVGAGLSASHVSDLLRAVPHLLFRGAFSGASDPLYRYGAVWWSLATEVQFYLLLPLLAVFLRTAARRRIGLALLALYAALYVAAVQGWIGTRLSIGATMALWNSVFGRGVVFLCGVGAAAVHRQIGSALRERLATVGWLRRGGADIAVLGIVLAIGLLLQWIVRHEPIRFSTPYQPLHLAAGVLWALLLLLLLVAPLRAKPLLSNPLLAELGILSYSIYLVHAPFMFFLIQAFVGPRAWTPRACALVFVLTIALVGVCSLTYRFIERPFLVRKAHFDP